MLRFKRNTPCSIDAWNACHGRDAAPRDEAPHDTVVEVRNVQLSGAVLGERGDLSESCTQSRSAVAGGSGLAAACDSDEALTARVVPEHLMSSGVGHEDAAGAVDEQAVRKSQARRLCTRQGNRNENEREKEEYSTHQRILRVRR